VANIDILVPVSGGKDSQACLKLASKTTKRVLGLFCDTQFEHPITYDHVKKLSSLYNVEIVTITGGSVLEKTLKYKRFPGGGARHCTDELKIRETKFFLKTMAEKQGSGFEVWYGMRLDESSERKKRYSNKIDEELYEPHEIMPRKYPKYLGKLGVKFKLPILNWTTKDVFNYLDGEQNQLYKHGFDRVGCFPCLAAGDRHKELAFNFDEFGKKQYEQVIQVSKVINKNIFTSKGGIERNGCSVCEI
jgi:3'-phosphoadenosine 5'-phosphosulfate sulfotransferase (PAPS reductase)/FAD synthetase